MTDPSDPQIPLDLELGRRLANDRPVPGAEFRGALGRWLHAEDRGYGPRPEWLHAGVAAYLGAGAVLVAVGALQAAGTL